MIVRLLSQQPGGATVGERKRTCHLVPYVEPMEVPPALTAYCGLQIMSGAAELVDKPRGMPCESCLARSPVPAFAILCQFASRIGGSDGQL
jgi:hypothetical protein